MQERPEGEGRTEEASQKSAGTMKEILIYVAAMVVMTIVAVVLVMLLSPVLFKGNTEANTTPQQSPTPGEGAPDLGSSLDKDDVIYTFDAPIIVNTADPDAARFLSVKISLLFQNARTKSEVTNSEVLQYKMRDMFLMTFSAKTSAELQDNEVKEGLKRDLKNEIDDLFRKGSVKDIYFSEYVIQ